MLERFKLSHRWVVGLLGLIVGLVLGATFLTRSVLGLGSHSSAIARGTGTSIIQGGTGTPGFVPVLTTLAFDSEREAGTWTGAFDHLARASEKSNGTTSAQVTLHA